MTWVRFSLIVTGCALAGALLGGLLGLISALLTPRFFAHVLPWEDVAPIGFATFAGGFIGFFLGGLLGLIGSIIQFICDCQRRIRW